MDRPVAGMETRGYDCCPGFPELDIKAVENFITHGQLLGLPIFYLLPI